MRVNSLLIRAAATSTSGTLNDLTTDLIMANNNKVPTFPTFCFGLPRAVSKCREFLLKCVLLVLLYRVANLQLIFL